MSAPTPARSEMVVEKVAQALWPEGWETGPMFNSAERFHMRDKARIQAPAAIAAVFDNLPIATIIDAYDRAVSAGSLHPAACAAAISAARRSVLGHD